MAGLGQTFAHSDLIGRSSSESPFAPLTAAGSSWPSRFQGPSAASSAGGATACKFWGHQPSDFEAALWLLFRLIPASFNLSSD